MKALRYVIRAVKYLVFLCVLYIGLEWLMLVISPSPATMGLDVWDILELRLATQKGKMLVGAFVILAAFYPLFGFARKRIDGCSFERDMTRINNAMQLYGFKLKEDRGDVKVYKADNIIRSLTMLFEDKIEVRATESGVEISGLRSKIARVAYQLETYIYHSRHEEENQDNA